ncbi:hypothetical protein LJC16_01610 [Bacteroidales bacterium OttesenSCG-928-C19]|nr:hypothetical protein [Bacteroidales bacterium OttesenSCG-928-C19]
MNKNFLLIVCTFIFFASCKTTFTASDRATLERGGVSLKQVQYYNDKPIEIKREISLEELKTVSGKVQIENGLHYEYIYFPKETNAVCIEDGNSKYLVISFEEGASFVFWMDDDGTHFRIGDKNTKKLADGGDVLYGGEKYNIIKGHDAILLFQNNIKNKQSTERRVVKGIKVH